jgi:SAM-dependent methyltransferase
MTAVDISEGMLAQAGGKISAQCIDYVCMDMLEYMRSQPSNSAALVVSGWAIGYSQPNSIIREAARVLKSGGTLAFVVNYADTLRPVWRAFRDCMRRFPDAVNLAYYARFPEKLEQLRRTLTKANFTDIWHDEGEHIIIPPADVHERGMLTWLLQTGVLAGFDRMLPFTESEQLAEYFEQRLQADQEPITHHYVMMRGRR